MVTGSSVRWEKDFHERGKRVNISLMPGRGKAGALAAYLRIDAEHGHLRRVAAASFASVHSCALGGEQPR